ncbi:MAG TPA: FAD-dependent oxidoreductase [Firmicutes bacterium]|nr:FAD-dependent oxidoreductase [Bacillota bacterium]
MAREYVKLFEPIRIANVEIKNKIAMAPMGNLGLSTSDGCFSQRGVDYFVERAKGGTGLIITGVTKIENEIEKLVPGLAPMVSLNPARFIQTASEMTERVHSYGSKIFLQLGIGLGRVGSPHMVLTHPVAPSPIPNYWEPSITCRELTTAEVDTLIKKAVEAAAIAAQAGFDGVEIHAVHEGYLLDQFTIALFNKRTDEYGGDLRGRLNFPVKIVKGIKKALGPGFPVILRFSIKSFIKDWNQGGLPDEDFVEKGRDVPEGLEAAKILEEAGYDAFDADGGSYDAWYWAHPPMYQKHGCYLPLIEELKRAVKVPVLSAGRLDIPDLAESVLAEGKADMVVVGRGLLADPYWPNKVLEGRTDDIRPCIGCHDGCLGRIFLARPLSCAVNPACGREKEYGIAPAGDKKSVMVVGGGIAGMEAARVAALRGHTVDLYEKSDSLGGHVIEASVPEFKKDIARLLEWYKNQMTKVGVRIHLRTEVDPQLIEEKKPDAVVVATGSEPVMPTVPGLDKAKVSTASDIFLGKKEAGDRVAVIGGGLVGCEVALWLAQQGKRVVIVEMLSDLMLSGVPVPHANRIMLKDLLKFHGVEVLTNTSLAEVTDEGAVVKDAESRTKTIPADTVVIAVGMKPNDTLFKSLAKTTKAFCIGDSRKPQNIMYSIWDAYEVARGL